MHLRRITAGEFTRVKLMQHQMKNMVHTPGQIRHDRSPPYTWWGLMLEVQAGHWPARGALRAAPHNLDGKRTPPRNAVVKTRAGKITLNWEAQVAEPSQNRLIAVRCCY